MELGTKNRPLRVFNFGAGTQSMAVAVLQAQGKIEPFDLFIFANVGEDSEDPRVLDYLAAYGLPYMQKNKIPFVSVQKTLRQKPITLLQYLLRKNRSVPIPVRGWNNKPQNRSCTNDFKIVPVDKYVKSLGYEYVESGLGFSLDESQRADTKPRDWHALHGKRKFGFYKKYVYPLLDLNMTRDQSIALVQSVGLPRPPMSACWFCPFKKRFEWIEDRKNRINIVQKAALLEAIINKKLGKANDYDMYYIHPSTGGVMHPMVNAIGDQMSLFEETCEDWVCGI